MDHPKITPRRPSPITDDHSQPIAPGRRPSNNSPSGNNKGPNLIKLVYAIIGLTLLYFALTVVGEILQIVGLGDITNTISGGLKAMPIIIIVGIIAAIVFRNVVVVPQGSAYIVERLGKYHSTWEAGLHLKIPFIDRVVKKISVKEQVMDFEPQSVITKDNVTMKIDTVVYMKIIDPRLATYGVEHLIPAIENLTATTLRNIIGEMQLDETLTSRDTINGKMQQILDEVTDPWGVKVNRVELKNIMPPRDIQEAMEKQMRAEREKREAILRAEGQKQARILEATGMKEATILEAEASKKKAILEAEADREAAIARAEGEAAAIEKLKKAEASGITMLKEAAIDENVLRLTAIKAMSDISQSKGSTLVVPTELASMVGTLAVAKGAITGDKKET